MLMSLNLTTIKIIKKKPRRKRSFLSNVLRRHWTLVEKWWWSFPVETMCIYICGHARESSIENHAQPLVDSISPPYFFIFYLKRKREREKKKNLITKWSSLFSLKTERQWWNSNSIFAFSYDIFRKKRKL